jgi:hypothetical protein
LLFGLLVHLLHWHSGIVQEEQAKGCVKRLLWVLLFGLLVHLLHWHSGMAVVPHFRLIRRKDLFKGRILWLLLFCLQVRLLH